MIKQLDTASSLTADRFILSLLEISLPLRFCKDKLCVHKFKDNVHDQIPGLLYLKLQGKAYSLYWDVTITKWPLQNGTLPLTCQNITWEPATLFQLVNSDHWRKSCWNYQIHLPGKISMQVTCLSWADISFSVPLTPEKGSVFTDEAKSFWLDNMSNRIKEPGNRNLSCFKKSFRYSCAKIISKN